MSIKLKTAPPEYEVAYQEMVALVHKHADKLDAMELLAVAANMVGKLVALQDQRKYSPGQVMDIVAMNIEHGNKQALAQLDQPKGNA